MEVNARNYQWQHLATVCGANLAYAAYRDVLGQPVTPVSAPTSIDATSGVSHRGDRAHGGDATRGRTPERGGKRWILAATDLAMTPGEILRGETSLWDWLGSWRGVVVDGIFSWRDPLPGLHYLRNKLSRTKARPDRGQGADPSGAQPGPGRRS
jgi:predicted ATP-grasp superfamily ATP-dependent carboligase